MRLLVVLAHWIVYTVKAVTRWKRTWGSESWPFARATLQHSDVRYDNDVLIAEIVYSYSALGEYYSGFHQRSFAREKSAWAYLRQFPQDFPVRYDPRHPEISTVREQDVQPLAASAAG